DDGRLLDDRWRPLSRKTRAAVAEQFGVLAEVNDLQLAGNAGAVANRAVRIDCDRAGVDCDRSLSAHHGITFIGREGAVDPPNEVTVSRVAFTLRRLHHEKTGTLNRHVHRAPR